MIETVTVAMVECDRRQRTRAILLFGVCIPVRIAMAIAARRRWLLGPLAVGCAVVALAWVRIIAFAPRDVGPETFGDRIWWQRHRVVHLALYTAFVALAAHPRTRHVAWVALAMDAAFGAASALIHHMWFAVGCERVVDITHATASTPPAHVLGFKG